MVAEENKDLTNDGQDKNVSIENSAEDENNEKENIEDEDQAAETMVAEGLNGSSEEDLEAQMATQLAANGLASEDDEDLESQMAATMEEDISGDEKLLDTLSSEMEDSVTPVKQVSFQQLAPSDEAGDRVNIDRLVDVSLNLSVELGRKNMRIKEILNLGPGKIIELDKLAGEPVDLLINGKLLAKGEVVVVDENFGVRITELVDPIDRIKMLK